MNLILLDPTEFPDGDRARAVLAGRRARHASEVLGATPGTRLRVGVLDGPLGTAEVVVSAPDRLELACSFESGAGLDTPQDTLLLAVPRPKVLARCLEHATALGYRRIVLLRTWHVDRSHLASRVLEPSRLRAHLLAGLEQARRTRLPEIQIEPLFKPFVEDRLEALLAAQRHRFVGHPGPATAGADPGLPRGEAALALAIGPERGFTTYEVEALRARGFRIASLGQNPLRVETALAALTGRLTGARTGDAGPDRT